MIALRDEFESIQALLLHRSLLPSLDSVVFELISKETRLQTLYSSISSNSDLMAATPYRETSKVYTQPTRVVGNASDGQSMRFMGKIFLL